MTIEFIKNLSKLNNLGIDIESSDFIDKNGGKCWRLIITKDDKVICTFLNTGGEKSAINDMKAMFAIIAINELINNNSKYVVK